VEDRDERRENREPSFFLVELMEDLANVGCRERDEGHRDESRSATQLGRSQAASARPIEATAASATSTVDSRSIPSCLL
jgi:hypothetical protein